ncbi:nuclear transport factor 2 family protein [Streptomyces sp. NP-1717]|uniref:nuclear transport factor 2 family protein n=1 Tax=unclassified Streptomyces TaxID=2593676 RepID=UPI001F5D40FC|nr:nuclear transport factor 2 family protein [Streptomyces sp. NP-1717]MCI3223036.1 nuclear transport factor 2 family protein [Streptomyces sp. NP-1717]WTA74237.1 nuclear transport factor 2 family protein [Streptomyces sp. NBC_00838]
MPLLPDTGYTPTQDELASVEAWFAEYDAHSAGRDIARMADLAVFPLNLVSDNAAGDGASAQWDREQFIGTMTQVMGEGADGDLSFDSVRTPVFLTSAMAVVFTDSTMTTAAGETQQLRYADVLIKRNGEWAFQTMIQGGWGDSLS